MERLSWTIQADPNEITEVLRKGRREGQRGNRRQDDRRGGWDARKKPQDKEHRRPPESRESRETDSPPEPPEGTGPAHPVTAAQWSCPGSWPPEPYGNRFVLFRATKCAVTHSTGHRKLTRAPLFLPSTTCLAVIFFQSLLPEFNLFFFLLSPFFVCLFVCC